MPDYNLNANQTAPAQEAIAVTPHDTNNIDPARGLYIGGAGNVKVVTARGTTTTFVGVAAGSILPVGVTRVFSTDTTATNIVALY